MAMSREASKLLQELKSCDLKMAAFDFAKRLRGGVYPKEMAFALDFFTRLPCPETAMLLIATCPEAAEIISLSNSRFATSMPPDMRGPHYEGLEEWMQSFEQNLLACEAIHRFLLDGATSGIITIGFHRMRDQQALFDRLTLIGFRKGFFKSGRQFLRDTVTRQISAFRSVSDLICIHGIHDRRERFWNAIGAELGPQLHLQSEMQYDLGSQASAFAELLKQVTVARQTRDDA